MCFVVVLLSFVFIFMLRSVNIGMELVADPSVIFLDGLLFVLSPLSLLSHSLSLVRTRVCRADERSGQHEQQRSVHVSAPHCGSRPDRGHRCVLLFV